MVATDACGSVHDGKGVVSMSTQPHTSDTPTCNFTAGEDFSTTDGSVVTADSEDACCQACFNQPTCLVGVFQPSSKHCYLKGGLIKQIASGKPGITACLARQPPNPAPEFDCSALDANCAGRIGATHWNPCYYINASAPCLIDGAQAVAGMGSEVIKIALFDPAGNYPFNSPDWPSEGFATLLDMARHPYYTQLWKMPQFRTYVLIAYSTVGGTSGGDISYWVKGITEVQESEETRQLAETAEYLLRTFGVPLNKTFVFENWEGDWASRGGGYDPSKPASELARMSMRRWLAARQAGVTLARHSVSGAGSGSANVLYSAEVNLVQESRVSGFPNMINTVVPFVELDMVSYSSYDTESDAITFRAALHFIQQNHNRTEASPLGGRAYFVAEYGVAQNETPNATLVATVKNVVNEALAFGVSYVLFWETYDNECTGGVGCSAGRCHDKNHPVTDPSNLHGFWLVRPDGSKAWPYIYLKSKIAKKGNVAHTL